MKITIYSTTTCPYCKQLKDYLSEKNIAFEEKLVDQSDEARDKMMQESDGFLGVPFIVIEKEEEKTKITGFDKNKINEVLGIS